MQEKRGKLVTIITEAVLEQTLLQELQHLGASGYTVSDARGKGARGVRTADWELTGNVRIEVLCDSTRAASITAHLWDRYHQNYAMVLFTTDVEVLRPEKF